MKNTIAIILFCMLSCFTKAQKVVEKHIASSDNKNIQLNMQIADSIRIITWNKNEVYAKASIDINNNKDNDVYLTDFDESGSSIEVTAKFDDVKKNVGYNDSCHCCCNYNSKIYWDVYIPEQATFSVETIDGNIISVPSGPSIYIDRPGTYIVYQFLQAGCSIYATDTIRVMPGTNCRILEQNLVNFHGELNNNDIVKLDWQVLNNQELQFFEIERSYDGINFERIDRVKSTSESTEASYSYNDDASKIFSKFVFYRIKLVDVNSEVSYSNIVNVRLPSSVGKTKVSIVPNPVRDVMNLQIFARTSREIRIDFFDQSGRLVSSNKFEQKGRSIISLDDLANKPRGIYFALVYVDSEIFRQKIIVAR